MGELDRPALVFVLGQKAQFTSAFCPHRRPRSRRNVNATMLSFSSAWSRATRRAPFVRVLRLGSRCSGGSRSRRTCDWRTYGRKSAEQPVDRRNQHAVALGSIGGNKGGKARAKALSAKRRKEIAQLAASARWDKQKW